MVKREMYSAKVKYQAVQMKLARKPMKEILKKLGIKNESQVKTWVKWFQNGETYRFEQPVGKQYSYGKGVVENLSGSERDQQELKRLRLENEVLKKIQNLGKGVVPKVFIELVIDMEGKATVSELCDLFDVARSTYYRWKKKWENARLDVVEERSKLEQEIENLCTENKFRYGYRTIRDLLRQAGRKVNRKTVQRIMQKYG